MHRANITFDDVVDLIEFVGGSVVEQELTKMLNDLQNRDLEALLKEGQLKLNNPFEDPEIKTTEAEASVGSTYSKAEEISSSKNDSPTFEDIFHNLQFGTEDQKLHSSTRRMCCLCGKMEMSASSLENSHFIPHSILKRIGQNIPTVSTDLSVEADASSTSKMWTRKLLCHGCEQKFSNKIEGTLSQIKIGSRLECFPPPTKCKEGENSWTKKWVLGQGPEGNCRICAPGKKLFLSIIYRSHLMWSVDYFETNWDLLKKLHHYFYDLLIKGEENRDCDDIEFCVLYDPPIGIGLGSFSFCENYGDFQYAARFWTTKVCRNQVKIGHVTLLFTGKIKDRDLFLYIDATKISTYRKLVLQTIKMYVNDYKHLTNLETFKDIIKMYYTEGYTSMIDDFCAKNNITNNNSTSIEAILQHVTSIADAQAILNSVTF